MSDFFIKEMTDNTVALMTETGYIIGKFDDIDDTNEIFFEEFNAQEESTFKTRESR